MAIVHHHSGEQHGGRPLASCGIYVDRATTDPAKITCFRPKCREHAVKVEKPRRIALTITPATETHCGECPFLVADWTTMRSADRCRAFNKLVDFRFGPTGGAAGGYYIRLPEYIAAEVK